MRIVSVEDCKTQALSLRKKSEAMGHQVVESRTGDGPGTISARVASAW